MRLAFIFIIFIIFISHISYSQDSYSLYSSFRLAANKGNFENALIYFNQWIAKEHNLDSLQRIFIDEDLDLIRKSDLWKTMDDSIKRIYFNHYPQILKKDISINLWKIGAEDQKYRSLNKYYHTDLPNFNDTSYQTFIKYLINEQNDREDIVYDWIKIYGWLDYKLVGQHAEKACFYIIQHSDYKLQMKCLTQLKKSVDSGNSDPYHYAMMMDRIRISRGKKQLYGTQLKAKQGKLYISENPIKFDPNEWELYETKDERKVNQRRSKLGLKPLEVDLHEKFNIEYLPKTK